MLREDDLHLPRTGWGQIGLGLGVPGRAGLDRQRGQRARARAWQLGHVARGCRLGSH
jgi:hypothetical protein